MQKNIVVLSDGTGQEGGKGHDTNVYKLFRMLEDRTERQIVFYDEGLGTDWRKFTGNAFGAGFTKNLLQCYQFIFDNYNAGDRIYLLGFSRGAATVRSLTSFIHYFGILPKSRLELIKRAYRLYLKGQDQVGSELIKRVSKLYTKGQDGDTWKDILNEKATDFVHEHPNQWAKIEFLGVWDTVPALGVVALAGLNSFLGRILKYNFHNFRLHPSVKYAYHALSIDDDRLWFHPSLWTEKTREEQIVEQVWFSGAHTDIGGGFKESGLSDITLEWMVEKAVSHGLRIYLGSRRYWNFVVAPDPTDRYHPAREGFGKIFKEGKRFKEDERNDVWTKQGAKAAFGAPIIHKSVLERYGRRKAGSSSEEEENPWILKRIMKSSDKDFKVLLRRKFYEDVKIEWEKYNSWVTQDLSFEDWIKKSAYKEYYKSYDWDYQKVYTDDGYKEHCKMCWKEKKTPETRSEWIDKYRNNNQLDPDWLESYKPYKKWYGEHTAEYKGQTYFVEPIKRLEEFEIPRPLQDVDEEKSDKTSVDKAPMSLRDYDEGQSGALMKKEDTGLLRRGNNKKKNFNRIEYDLGRWEGKDKSYNENFRAKRNMNK